jgi:hypothetical protein
MTTGKSNSDRQRLLKQPRKVRLEYFQAFKVGHPLLLDAYEELRCAIRDSNPGSIIFLCGTTGVGKTTLLEHTVEYLKGSLSTELIDDRERIPVVLYQADSPTSTSFDWKYYFQRLLLELEEPLVDNKQELSGGRRHPANHDANESNLELISSEKPGIRVLRIATERTLRRRRPYAVLIDEAQHIGVTSSGRQLLNQLNVLKSLAAKSKITHVLCGTYELIPFRNLNGQLSRRSMDIHFRRYNAERESHRQQFVNLLYTFQERLPLPETPDLVSRWDYFYERSIGSVGVLKDWLYHSLGLALADDSPTLKLKYLEQRALSVKQCTTMLRESMLAEREFEDSEESRALLRRDLGLEATALKIAQDSVPQIGLEQPADSHQKRRKPRVGRRSPVRDKIGTKVS